RVTYDTALPTISGTFPSNGALVQGKRSRIYLDAYDSGGSLSRKVLQVTRDEEATWLDVIEIPLNKTEVYWDTTAPVGETGVLADGPYKFRFSVWDSAGNNRVSSVMVWTVDNTRPEPPADLTAAAETGKITLNWPASVSGDLRTSSPYTVYRSGRSGGGYTSLATTNNTNYTDTSAEGGKTYYYVVTATDKAGNESAYSKEAAGQITADVTAPVFLSVPAEGSTYGNTYPSTGGTGTSFTQYLSATDDSPQGVKQFKVEYSNDGGATWKAFTSGASSGTSGGTKYYYTTFYISTAGMTHGPYLFRYSATDYSGNTVVSPVKNMTVDLTAYPVRNLSARPGEASAILEWELPETAEPSVYQIWRSTYYSGGYNRIGDSLASTTQSYTDSGVSIGTTYYYKVITLDNYGNTAASPIASTVPTDDLTPPEIIQVYTEDGALIGGKSVSLSLDARDNKEPTQILFSGSQDGGVTWHPLQVSFSGRSPKPGNLYSFTYNWNPAGLTSGEIQVRMTAKDAAGNSSAAVTRTWTLDLTVSPPANLRATGGDGSILIEWDGISDTDLGTYVYTVLRAEKTGGPYTVLESLLPKDKTSYTDNNAATGVTYYYVVRSRDILGNEAQSEELAATPAGDEIPPFIDSVVPASGATMGGDASQELRVYATDNAGWIGTTAAFAYSADGGTGWLPVNTVYDGPTNYDGTKFYFRCYWDLGGLPTGEYKVRYTVTDSSGNSTSQIVDYSVDRTPPSPPKNLLANYGSLNIGLGWEIPPEADVTGYRVYRSNSMHDSYVKIGDVAGKESNSFADNTVVSGVLYYYRVTAIDAFLQEGEPSNIASAKAEADHIPPEVILMEPDYYTVVGAVAKITVRAEDNSALSSISLEYYNAATESWVPINTIATLDTAVFNWSTAGLSGEIRVRAIAKDSAGNFSSPEDGKAIKIYIIDNAGPAVTGLKGTSFGGDIVLEWDNVTDKDFDYFLVEKQDENGTYREVRKVYNVLGLNVTGLTPNTDYRFRVTAFDKAGNPGEPAEITVNSGGDTLPPVVDFQAQWYQIYYGNQSILIDAFEARDNVGVKKIIAQYSADGTTWVDIGDRTLDTPVAKLRTGELWDVSALPDGVYDVRIIAEDEAGNRSRPSEPAYYFVDHLVPAAPTGLELSSTAGYINLSWKYEAERDFWYFRLWRAETEEGPYEPLLLGKYQYLRYLDRNVENGKTYYYKVTVVDRAGNESAYSAVISGGLSPDTNPPYLYLYDPIDGNVLSLKTRFNVNVWDDLALKSLAIRYRAAGTAGEWGEVFHKDYDLDGTAAVTSREETFFWDTKDLPEGRYDIHYIVTDKAGNVTDALVMTHLMNNIPPDTPTLSGVPGGWSASLSWTCGLEPEDFFRYTVYKTDQLGGNFRNIGSTAEKAFADPDVRPGIRYYYYVRAYDVYGNYSQSNTINLVPTNEDLLAPLAKAGDDLVLTEELEGYFDGTLSSDNDRIAAYSWDFGDGGASSAAQPVHAYTDSGSYTVTLTVRDPAGNTGTDTVTVTVVSPDEVGILEVKVINDATGELLPGASVVIDYPDGASLKTTTNTVGAAFVVAPPGAYQVYAFKTGFKPASQKVVMERGTRNTIMIRLPKGPVVTGELKAERMTLDQIIAAGIDISDPENRQAYQFEIGLGFMDQPVIMTQNRFLPPPMAPANFTINEDGTRIFIFEPVGEDGSGGRIFIGEKLDLGGGGPAMAYMIIPGKTAWLKEFFDIGLTIQNGADPEYIIEGAYAKLTLPDGLSLAPTREGQHLYMEMGDIAGGETGSANWIIRGDQKGEYRLEAEFSGTIMPFGDVIRQFFRNEEPIRVWGGNALKMHVQAQDRADKGYPYNLRVGIENASDIPLYHVDFELLEETKVNYIYTPNQKMSETIEEMAAGTTIWKDFQLIPAVDGDLNLGNSFILRTGGEADIETDTTSVSVPENAVGTAPVLTQVNNANETVDLSWDAVDGAVGYKIYRVRQDLNMSLEPEDLVYTCDSDVLSVNLSEPEGPGDYVIKTVTAAGERMRHAMTGFSWIDYLGEATLTLYPEE
ncbi:MAG: PKD domain-containing protein, partial [Lawsonibacter sp.]